MNMLRIDYEEEEEHTQSAVYHAKIKVPSGAVFSLNFIREEG